MDVIPALLRWQFALVSLQDILVFSKSPEVHIEQFRRVLRLLFKAVVLLKLKKYMSFAETIDYQGILSDLAA